MIVTKYFQYRDRDLEKAESFIIKPQKYFTVFSARLFFLTRLHLNITIVNLAKKTLLYILVYWRFYGNSSLYSLPYKDISFWQGFPKDMSCTLRMQQFQNQQNFRMQQNFWKILLHFICYNVKFCYILECSTYFQILHLFSHICSFFNSDIF